MLRVKLAVPKLASRGCYKTEPRLLCQLCIFTQSSFLIQKSREKFNTIIIMNLHLLCSVIKYFIFPFLPIFLQSICRASLERLRITMMKSEQQTSLKQLLNVDSPEEPAGLQVVYIILERTEEPEAFCSALHTQRPS